MDQSDSRRHQDKFGRMVINMVHTSNLHAQASLRTYYILILYARQPLADRKGQTMKPMKTDTADDHR